MTRVSANLRFLSDVSSISGGNIAAFSRAQLQNDASSYGLSEELSHWQSLSAMTLGSLSYRLSGLVLRSVMPGLSRYLAPAFALGSEVATYELSQRSLLSLSDSTSHSNLFSWSGTGGIEEGLRVSYVNFAFLKIGGHFHSRNLFLQHLTQASAMVAGHAATAGLGWVEEEKGSLFERLVHAEAMNLQMGIAMTLLHGFLPQVRSIENDVNRRIHALPTAENFQFRNNVENLAMRSARRTRQPVPPGVLPMPAIIQGYFSELESLDVQVRLGGLRALGMLKPEARINGRILMCLGDPEAQVRLEAIKIMDRNDPVQLLEVLRQLQGKPDPDSGVRFLIETVICRKVVHSSPLVPFDHTAQAKAERDLLQLMRPNMGLLIAMGGTWGAVFDAAFARRTGSDGFLRREITDGTLRKKLPARRAPDQIIPADLGLSSYRGRYTVEAWRRHARQALSDDRRREVTRCREQVEKNLRGKLHKDNLWLQGLMETALIEERYGTLEAIRQRTVTDRIVEALRCIEVEQRSTFYEVILEQILDHSQTQEQVGALVEQYFVFCKTLGQRNFKASLSASFDRRVLYEVGRELPEGSRWYFNEQVEFVIDEVFAGIYEEFLLRGISAEEAVLEMETLLREGRLHRAVIHRWENCRSSAVSPFESVDERHPVEQFDAACKHLLEKKDLPSPREDREACVVLARISAVHPDLFRSEHLAVLLKIFEERRLFEINEIFRNILDATYFPDTDPVIGLQILNAHLAYEIGDIETFPVEFKGGDCLDPSLEARERVIDLARRYKEFFYIRHLTINSTAWLQSGSQHVLDGWRRELLSVFGMRDDAGVIAEMNAQVIARHHVNTHPLTQDSESRSRLLEGEEVPLPLIRTPQAIPLVGPPRTSSKPGPNH